MRWLALVLGALAGCDSVIGLDDPLPHCSAATFDAAKTVDIVSADDFSVSWSSQRGVVALSGSASEVSLADNSQTAIDLGVPYMPQSLALSPEGDALLFTASIEPLTMYAAVRGDATWRLDPNVPVGTYAGTPSEDAIGPRRLLVRMRMGGELQEYEDRGGLWKPVGDQHDFAGLFSANLTENALTMVYAGVQDDGSPAVFQATRESTSDWFGAPTVILTGDHKDPQLVDQCHKLFVVDPAPEGSYFSILRRYDH